MTCGRTASELVVEPAWANLDWYEFVTTTTGLPLAGDAQFILSARYLPRRLECILHAIALLGGPTEPFDLLSLRVSL